MASSTTINTWMDSLVASLLPPSTPPTDARKYKENFMRQAKTHTYGRTNQFSVIERLNGLEEKLQVQNLDDVAQELYSRRMKLNIAEDRWLPDVLDLLLHLSVAPVKYSRVSNLERIKPKPQIPPALTWKDIEAIDPIDREDDIWNIPDYSDFSSEEDEVIVSSTSASPVPAKESRSINPAISRTIEVGPREETSSIAGFASSQFWNKSGFSITTTEQQTIREVLMMLSGFPTSMFNVYGNELKPDPRYRLRNVEVETSSRFLSQAAELGSTVRSVMLWVGKARTERVMLIIENHFRDTLIQFHHFINDLQMGVSNGDDPNGIATLLELLHRINEASAPLKSISTLLLRLPPDEPVTALNILYRHVDLAYSCCDQPTISIILPVFNAAFEAYAAPIDTWIQTGVLDQKVNTFISKAAALKNPASLWHDWFSLVPEKDRLIPVFLKQYASKIFNAGKTAAFSRYLDQSKKHDADAAQLGIAKLAHDALNMTKGLPVPFTTSFETLIETRLSCILLNATNFLKGLLEEQCGLSCLLDAFQYIYLGSNGAVLSTWEARMFDQIDKCVEIWNDRFLVVDTLAEAFVDIKCIDPELLSVQSKYTSSRTMESRRRSVKILSALTISYDFSWAIANIILPDTINSYQRVSLVLGQIRRARFLLERRAYFCVQNIPLTGDSTVQNAARAMCFTMSLFVNIVYDHFTSCTISSMSENMRNKLEGTVDEMIFIHTEYTKLLELACLCGQRIKPLHDSLLAILDLCLRFTDIVSSSLTTANHPSKDFEASSFISARSQRRKKRKTDVESTSDSDEEDEDEMGEGYSTFILDEDTSIADEIANIKQAFTEHVTFLMAGLRGVARSSGEVGDLLELLADSLECLFPQRRIGMY
ncbi:hypothetical protein LTR84_010925 [Exophiala bonariae]|uniref:Spindle pole body component n=1 Tax=Exophiala bonariae TaxID=1690606 RepID=A0AAV9NLG5_9EURO|nr:hypothetical protein LTR84_010925 [Exophiala bonariae]